jgi:DnaJ like chaperone protein
MSIWERLAIAVGNISVGATLGPRFAAEVPHDSLAVNDGQADALPFTIGMIVLGAKMAKADGVVTKDEVHAFKKAFKVSDAEMRSAVRVFNLAKQDPSGFESSAKELVTVFKGDRKILEYTLDGLFQIAKADDVLHPGEEKFLSQVAKQLGFTDADFALMRARHTPVQDRNPYDVLGLESSVSQEELKSQYQRLVSQSQPNEFVARGLPKEFVVIATEKLAAITQAYETIARQRGTD